MYPGLEDHLLSDQAGRLAAAVDLLDGTALGSFDGERAGALLGRAEVLVTGWGCPPIDEAALARAPRLGLVAHAAGTVKDHVTSAVFDAGITVTSAAAANAVPVAEYTLAMILLANKEVFAAERRYRAERRLDWFSLTAGNRAKTVGIVGASRVGRALLERLRPFELDVVVSDPYLTDADAAALGVERVELQELLRRSHVVTIHAPDLPETHHLIGRDELALLRDGATLINTARGSLVDTGALIDELRSGRIAAVLDVTDPEPLPAGSPLFDLPNVVLTPHVAGSEGTELPRLAACAIDEIERWVRGEPLEHEVTADDLARIA